MKPFIYIDPNINMESEEMLEIIIQFKTKPINRQMADVKSNQTLDMAKKSVEASHHRFRNELADHLGENHISYEIVTVYKNVYNGVMIRLRGQHINYLLQSDEIESVHMNDTLHIPIKPNDPRYQI